MANANDAKRMTKNNAKLLPTSGTKGLCQEERDGDRMAMKETGIGSPPQTVLLLLMMMMMVVMRILLATFSAGLCYE